jgi:hypothetical protein
VDKLYAAGNEQADWCSSPVTDSNSKTCAVCTDNRATFEEGLPVNWEEHLRETRDWIPVGSPRVPLCSECKPQYDILKSGGYGPISADDEEVAALLEQISTEHIVEHFSFPSGE